MKTDIEIAQLKAENEQLRKHNKWLLEQLHIARHKRFGTSSEKSTLDDGEQLNLFNEAESTLLIINRNTRWWLNEK